MEGDLCSPKGGHQICGTAKEIHSRKLSDPQDKLFLSESYCLIRQQLEVFVATPRDVENRAPKGGTSKSVIEVGSVGIRCVHCSGASSGKRGASLETEKESTAKSTDDAKTCGKKETRWTYKGSVSYPKAIRLVYQSVRNWQRNHFMSCPCMPEHVKEKYLALMKSKKKKRSTMDSISYWQKCMSEMGLVDTPRGIRLRNGVFESSPSSVTSSSAAVLEETGKSGAGRGRLSDGIGQSKSKIDRENKSQFAKKGTKAQELLSSTTYAEAAAENSAVDSTSDPHFSFNTDPSRENTSPLIDVRSNIQEGYSDVAPDVTYEVSSLSDRAQSQPEGNAQLLLPIATAAASGDKLDDSFSAASFGSEEFGRGTLAVNGDAPAYLSASCFASDNDSGAITTKEALVTEPEAGSSMIIPKEVLLNRVHLAHDLVEAVEDIRHVPPSCSSSGENDLHQREHGLFSLGAELYELFAGRHPFADKEGTSEDSSSSGEDSLPTRRLPPQLQLRKKTRKRGRQRYVPLNEFLGIPANLSDLVSDLLDAAGDNNTRDNKGGVYDSVNEVRDDLHLMLSRSDRFLFGLGECGQNRGMAQLEFSQDTLYGRGEECSTLMEAYFSMMSSNGGASRGSNVVLVSGYSGTGKSALVRKVQGDFMKMGACCVSGKFDAMQQVKPFSAIAGALDKYCLMLARDAGRADQVRKIVSAALGQEGSILADLIPNMHEILQLDVHDGHPMSHHRTTLSAPEAQQHLLSRLIRRLLRSTCTKACPLVLFLDDLQWADESSLEIINALIMDIQIEGLLLVGSYRDNEVGREHPLTVCLEGIRRSRGDAAVPSVHISNLDRESVNAMLSDLLCLLPRKTLSLADLIMQKTGGNALFVVQFLTSLRDDGLLRFSLTSRRWEWDVDEIQSHDIADTVVEFIRAKLLRLAPEVHEALKVAAAFGAQCHEDVFKIVDKDPHRLTNTVAALGVAVSEGLMAKFEGPAYQFVHDQIQSAAYLLIPESDRKAFHLQIGRSLWHHSSNEDIENYLFIMVDQLHRGAGLMTDHNDKAKLAQLSLLAGKKAYEMCAFFPAKTYLTAGIGLLGDEDWQSYRDLCFDLYNLVAETEFSLGDFEAMKSHLNNIFQRAKSLRENVRAYYTYMRSLLVKGNIIDAISTGLTVLGHLGEHFPSESSHMLVRQEIGITQNILSTKTETELLHLKVMEDAEKKEAMKFLSVVCAGSYVAKRAHFPLLVCRMVRISLSHGVCNESAGGFAWYGVILCGIQDLDGGYRFGKLALATLEKFQSRDLVAWTKCAVHGWINSWKEPMQASLAPLKNVVEVGISAGDIGYAMSCAHTYTGDALGSGYPLAPLYEEMQVYSKQMLGYKQQLLWAYNTPLRQATLNLLGRSDDPVKLIGEEMDENNFLQSLEGTANQNTVISSTLFYKMWLQYLFGRYEDAAATAEKNKSIVTTGRFALVCNHVFFDGLTALALSRRDGAAQYAIKIEATMAQMKTWASSTPWNCQHKLELMQAEHAYLVGDLDAAIRAYDAAVDSASNHRFVHEEALALERFGIFHLELGNHSAASGFFVRACNCYEQWGAHSKVSHVRQQYL